MKKLILTLSLTLSCACELQQNQLGKESNIRNDILDVCPEDITTLTGCVLFEDPYASENPTELFCEGQKDPDGSIERAVTEKFGTFENGAGSYQARIMTTESSIWIKADERDYTGLFFKIMDSKIQWSKTCEGQ